MSLRTWTGGAGAQTPTAQVWKGTVTDTTPANTYILTLTDEAGGTAAVTYTNGGAETVSTIALGIAALVNTSPDPRFKTIAATTSTGQVILTAATAGVPFYVAATGTGTWTGTGVTTASLGPNDWNVPGNWVEGVVPVATDDVTIGPSPGGTSYAILYGIKTGLALHAFSSIATFTQGHGGPGLYLSFTATSFYHASTGRSFIDLGSSNISPRIVNTGSATAPACGLCLKGSNLATVIVEGGSVDLAGVTGNTATAATVQAQGNARVRIGSGVTLTNYLQTGGTGELGCAATTVTVDAGTLTTVGTGAITTLTNNGATVYPNSTGTVSTLNCNAGTTDLSTSEIARTVTACTVAPGATLRYDPGSVTISGKVGTPTNIGPVEVKVATA